MRLRLGKFLELFIADVAMVVRQEIHELMDHAKNCDKLGVEMPIGGEMLPVEGASNLPDEYLAVEEFRFKTDMQIEADDEGVYVALTRGLFRPACPVEIEVKLKTKRLPESLENARDRANEVNRTTHHQDHARKHAIQRHRRDNPPEEPKPEEQDDG